MADTLKPLNAPLAMQPTRLPLPALVGGLPCISLRADDGATALVACFGAQVLSWKTPNGQEQLFLGRRAVLDGSVPVRGGVSICFPQFANFGPMAAHGFARTAPWQWATAPNANAQPGSQACSAAWFTLDAKSMPPGVLATMGWPHDFACQFEVSVGGDALTMRLRVTNPGQAPFDFQAALHTYLRVDNLDAMRVDGLQGASFIDRVAKDVEGTQAEAALSFTQQRDRIYPGAPARVVMREPGRAVAIDMVGFGDLVTWNPGAERCATIVDFAPDDFQRMVCVEAAQILKPIQMAPASTWVGEQRLVARA